MIKAVVFDWGGVLIEDPSMPLRKFCAARLKVSLERFREVFEPYQEPFHRGELAEEKLWREICAELRIDPPKTPSLWKEAFRHAHAPRREMFDLAVVLKQKGYRTGFLSNTEEPSVEFLQEQTYPDFDALVFSCEEKMAKPDRGIYLVMAERLGMKPEECVLIDDRKEYIRGAERAGLHGIVFSSFKNTVKELKKLGVRI